MPTAAVATFPFMLATLFKLSPDQLDQAEFWFYRIGGYLIQNVLDDPAWLALMFC